MKCNEWIELLNAYHDGELGGAERGVVESHLSGCADCRCRLKEYSLIDRLMAGMPSEQTSPEFREGFADRVKVRRTQHLLLRRPAMRIAAAITLVLAIGAVAKLCFATSKPVVMKNTVAQEYPNLNLLADPGFLGARQYGTGIGSELGVPALSPDAQSKER
jgi:anti-sigma factor RsiW